MPNMCCSPTPILFTWAIYSQIQFQHFPGLMLTPEFDSIPRNYTLDTSPKFPVINLWPSGYRCAISHRFRHHSLSIVGELKVSDNLLLTCHDNCNSGLVKWQWHAGKGTEKGQSRQSLHVPIDYTMLSVVQCVQPVTSSNSVISGISWRFHCVSTLDKSLVINDWTQFPICLPSLEKKV